MIIESELRDEIKRTIEGHSSLDSLYIWLMSRTWNMHKDSSPQAMDLASDVEVLFFEMSDGGLDEAEVRTELGRLL